MGGYLIVSVSPDVEKRASNSLTSESVFMREEIIGTLKLGLAMMVARPL